MVENEFFHFFTGLGVKLYMSYKKKSPKRIDTESIHGQVIEKFLLWRPENYHFQTNWVESQHVVEMDRYPWKLLVTISQIKTQTREEQIHETFGLLLKGAEVLTK